MEPRARLTHPLDSSAYVGRLLCGEANYIGEHILRASADRPLDIRVWRNHARRYHTEHSSDHCFMVVDGCWVIDLTVRQLWQSELSLSADCEFFRLVHHALPPFYVGSYDGLLRLHSRVQDAHESTFGHQPSAELLQTDNHWVRAADITHRFDLHASLTRPGYLAEKPAAEREFVGGLAAALGISGGLP